MPLLTALLPILLRPVAWLVAGVMGFKFAEGEFNKIFSGQPLTEEEAKKQGATTIGLLVGIGLGGLMIGGLGGPGRGKKAR